MRASGLTASPATRSRNSSACAARIACCGPARSRGPATVAIAAVRLRVAGGSVNGVKGPSPGWPENPRAPPGRRRCGLRWRRAPSLALSLVEGAGGGLDEGDGDDGGGLDAEDPGAQGDGEEAGGAGLGDLGGGEATLGADQQGGGARSREGVAKRVGALLF